MHCPALVTAETQGADGLTVRGNWRKKNKRGVTEEEEEEEEEKGWVETEIERQNHWSSTGGLVKGSEQDKYWQAETQNEKGRASSTLKAAAAASLVSGGESVTCSHTGTHVDKPLLPIAYGAAAQGVYSGGQQGWSQSFKERMRSITATWLTPGVSLSTCSGRLSTPAIKETGADGERAAEIMRGAESSCGFPIFGNSSSSRGGRSCGSTDSSRASWSCRKTGSSKAIHLSRDEGSTYSQGVTGISCRCSHSVECTCSQSSDSSCKVTTAVQSGVIVVVAGGQWLRTLNDQCGWWRPPGSACWNEPKEVVSRAPMPV